MNAEIKRIENNLVWLDIDTEKGIVIDGSEYWLDIRSGSERGSEKFSNLLSEVLTHLTDKQLQLLKELCPNDEILKSCFKTKYNFLYEKYLKIWEW